MADDLQPLNATDLIKIKFGNDSGKMLKIAKAESDMNAGAVNAKNTNGTKDYGLFQINSAHIPDLKKAGIIKSSGDLLNEKNNIEAAAYVRTKQGDNAWKSSRAKWDPNYGLEPLTDADKSKLNFATQKKEVTQAKKTVTPEDTVPEWGRKHPTLYGMAGAAYETLKPVAEAAGLVGGGLYGAASPLPGGAVLGAGLGYGAARRIGQIAGQALGNNPPESLPQSLKNAASDVAIGSSMEAGGQAAGPVLGTGLKYVGKYGGKLAAQVLGASTGAGPGMVDEALKGSTMFKEAMRGKITGNEIVENAKSALQSLKYQRAAAYQSKLAEVAAKQGVIDTTPIANKVSALLKQFNVKIIKATTPAGSVFDTSRIAMGKVGRNDIEDMLKKFNEWGSQPGDNTALGLDVLKRQLDDFYSESSPARAFVASLRKSVNDTIAQNVPEYGEMTKGYAEATSLIKDIESNLMLGKQGMSGRITADQTLRRLTSAMRENFELRGDLVNVLGKQGGQDLAGQIAGYSASQLIPRGLIGKLAAGSAGWLTHLNPKMWPVIAASSPRVVGEFLNIFGKGLQASKGASMPVGRAIGFAVGKGLEGNVNNAASNVGTALSPDSASAADLQSQSRKQFADQQALVNGTQQLADKWGAKLVLPPITLKQTLDTAAKVKGEIKTAPVGNTHDSILKGRDGQRGFRTPDGQFLNRKQAGEYVQQTQPGVAANLKAADKRSLTSESYAAAVKKTPKVLDESTAKVYLEKADGDVEKARAAARKDGYILKEE